MVNGHCVTAIHAEENAILQMCTTIGTTKGAFLYVTHSPCKQCAYRILQVGIAMVVYDKVYSNYDGIEILLDHHIAVNVLDQQGLLKPAGCGE
jgi:deoxycytidylate deaminase